VIRPFDEASAREAADILRAGGLVAFPTETVYGLGARADDSAAVLRIYAAKGRPLENPSIVHVADAAAALALARPNAIAEALAAKFWPGPLTLIMAPRDGVVAREVMAGGATLALRVPAHPAAARLLELVALPIAAPSANRSNAISPTTAAHVEKSLGARVDLILDGGATGFGIESTIVDVANAQPRILRRGSVSFESLATLVPNLLDAGDFVTPEAERAPSPGTYSRHYAPETPVEILRRAEIERRIAEAHGSVDAIALLLVGAPTFSIDGIGADRIVALPTDAAGYAAGLYAALHRLDEIRARELWIEAPPDAPSWAAVRDRLRRAAGRR
jgi:L-threonylcarbamoyladenylate synthase